MKIRVKRSEGWVRQQRLDTGSNVPEHLEVEVDPADLSLDCRQVLLNCGNGSYRDIERLNYNQDYELNVYAGCLSYGSMDIEVDADAPTVDQIDAAIRDCAWKLHEMKLKHEKEKAEREAEEARKAEDRRKQEEALATARELLSDELATLDQYKEDRATLGEFLANIPADARRGTLKAMASSSDSVDALISKIEDASPVWIFKDDDDDE